MMDLRTDSRDFYFAKLQEAFAEMENAFRRNDTATREFHELNEKYEKEISAPVVDDFNKEKV
jgi:hypothetical protein